MQPRAVDKNQNIKFTIRIMQFVIVFMIFFYNEDVFYLKFLKIEVIKS